jgi:hypothetical protein
MILVHLVMAAAKVRKARVVEKAAKAKMVGNPNSLAITGKSMEHANMEMIADSAMTPLLLVVRRLEP